MRLVLVLAIALAACGGSQAATEPQSVSNEYAEPPPARPACEERDVLLERLKRCDDHRAARFLALNSARDAGILGPGPASCQEQVLDLREQLDESHCAAGDADAPPGA